MPGHLHAEREGLPRQIWQLRGHHHVLGAAVLLAVVRAEVPVRGSLSVANAAHLPTYRMVPGFLA